METVRRLMIIISLVFLCIFLTACLEVKQTININKDGSGDARLEVAVMAAELIPKLKSEMPKGWDIIEEKEKEGKHVIVFGRKFKDVSELNDAEIRYTFSSERKSFMKKAYTLDIKQIRSSDMPFPYEITVKMPGSIAETNGEKVSSNYAKWNLEGFRRGKELSVKSSAFALPDFASLKESFNKVFNSILYREEIVFLRDGNLWVMDGDGKNQRQLTKEGASNFRLSRDGKTVAYFNRTTENNGNFYIITLSDNKIIKLADTNDCLAVDVSSDGGKVALVKVEEKYSETEAQQKVISEGANPAYVKEGAVKKTAIYIADIKTGQQKKVIGELPYQLLPKNKSNITEWVDYAFWSPDGNRLHFGRDFDPYCECGKLHDSYILNLSSGNIEDIGPQGAILNWNGNKILYTSEGVSWIFDIETKKSRDLGNLAYVAISSNGKKMAYSQGSNKKEGEYYVWWDTLYVKDMSSGKTQELLTSDKKENFGDLSWSIGDKKILFNRFIFDEKIRKTKSFLCSINADGSSLKKLGDEVSSPEWTVMPRITFISPSLLKIIILALIVLTGLLLLAGMALMARKAIKAVIPKIPKIPKRKTIPKGSFCTQCGKENPPTASFCTSCGQRLR